MDSCLMSALQVMVNWERVGAVGEELGNTRRCQLAYERGEEAGGGGLT